MVTASTSPGNKVHPIPVESGELEQYSPQSSHSICIQTLKLCCSAESKFSFSNGVSTLMHFIPAIKCPLFLTLHIAIKKQHQQWVRASHSVGSTVFRRIGCHGRAESSGSCKNFSPSSSFHNLLHILKNHSSLSSRPITCCPVHPAVQTQALIN